MVNEIETKHCPKCDSKDLLYQIDIFAEVGTSERYMGDVECQECGANFKDDEIKFRQWKEVTNGN